MSGIMFTLENGTCEVFDANRMLLYLCDGGCSVRHCGPPSGDYKPIKESPAEAIAILNAAMNPPGPGDATEREIKAVLPARHTVVISKLSTTHVLEWIGDGSDGQVVAYASDFDGDILATLASLEPKPAPRDELQKSHDAMVAKLRDIVDAKKDWLCGMGDILGPAECLVVETAKEPTE